MASTTMLLGMEHWVNWETTSLPMASLVGVGVTFVLLVLGWIWFRYSEQQDVPDPEERAKELQERLRQIRWEQQQQASQQATEAEKIRQEQVRQEKRKKAEAVVHQNLKGGSYLGGRATRKPKQQKKQMKEVRLEQQRQAQEQQQAMGINQQQDKPKAEVKKDRKPKEPRSNPRPSNTRSTHLPPPPRFNSNNVHILADFSASSSTSSFSNAWGRSSGGGGNHQNGSNWNTQGTRFMTPEDRWAQSDRGARMRRSGGGPPAPGNAPSSRGNWGR